MSVELMPANQLGFNRPLTQLVRRTIHIHNPHPHPIAFKVKTTAPKQYCVRPNSGRVEVGETVEVLVLLQPLDQDPPPHAKCKDKFLVQSAFITPDEEMRSLGEMWANVEKKDKSAIHEQKLKCVYLAAEDGVAANGIPEEVEEKGGDSKMDESFQNANSGFSRWTTLPEKTFDPSKYTNGGYTSYTIPQPVYIPPKGILVDGPIDDRQIFAAAESSSPIDSKDISSPKQASQLPSTSNATAIPAQASAPIPSLTTEDLKTTTSPTNVALEKLIQQPSASTGSTITKPSIPAPSVSETDKSKLEKALAEIQDLKKQLEEAKGPGAIGLRRRGGAAGAGGISGEVETVVEKAKEVVQSAQGVPVEVVAGLVVGVFVLTYLFF